MNSLPPGYSARTATKDDLETVVEIANLAAIGFMGAEDTSTDEIRIDWEDDDFALERDSRLVFSDNGKAVAVAEVFKNQSPPVKPYLWLRIHRGEENTCVGDYLMSWGEESARKVIDRVPKYARVTMLTHNVSGFAPMRDLLEKHGMEIMRHSLQMRIEMEHEPTQPNWAKEMQLKPFDERSDLEAAYRAHADAFRDHFGHIEESFEYGFPLFKRYMLEDEGYDPTLWFIAWDGDEIAGFSFCRKFSHEDAQMGWVMDLGVG